MNAQPGASFEPEPSPPYSRGATPTSNGVAERPTFWIPPEIFRVGVGAFGLIVECRFCEERIDSTCIQQHLSSGIHLTRRSARELSSTPTLPSAIGTPCFPDSPAYDAISAATGILAEPQECGAEDLFAGDFIGSDFAFDQIADADHFDCSLDSLFSALDKEDGLEKPPDLDSIMSDGIFENPTEMVVESNDSPEESQCGNLGDEAPVNADLAVEPSTDRQLMDSSTKEIPSWIPTDIFNVKSSRRFVAYGRGRLRHAIECKICGRKMIARSGATIQKHLKSRVHCSALNALGEPDELESGSEVANETEPTPSPATASDAENLANESVSPTENTSLQTLYMLFVRRREGRMFEWTHPSYHKHSLKPRNEVPAGVVTRRENARKLRSASPDVMIVAEVRPRRWTQSGQRLGDVIVID